MIKQTKKIGIVSLGLIGGSLFKCLKSHYENLVVVTRNTETIEKVKNEAMIATTDYSALKDCDIVFVCSPMNKTVEILDKLENIVRAETIVADVCSLKEFVIKKDRPYVFIGSHPMAGTENNGYDASFEDLFKGAKWVITPKDNTPKESIDILKNIISLTGAHTIIADAVEHDKAVALISHMPMLLAQALMLSAKDNELAKKLASSGFRDMTRLALSNTEMANDMLKMNSDNIFSSLIMLIEQSRLLFGEDYLKKIEEVKKIRSEMYDKNGKNIL